MQKCYSLCFLPEHFSSLKKKKGRIRESAYSSLKNVGLTNKTGTLDTLNKVFLAEEINHYQGSDNQDTRRISDNGIPQALTCVVRLQRNRNGFIDIRHEIGFVQGVDEEQGRIEVVRPLRLIRPQRFL